MRRFILPAIVLCAAIGGCSSNAAGSTAAQANKPGNAECAAVKAVVTANMQQLEAVVAGTDERQSMKFSQAYYQKIAGAIDSNGQTDPDSASVKSVAQHLEADYAKLALIADDPNDHQAELTDDLSAVQSDLSQLEGYQTALDGDCSIAAIEPT